MYLKYFQLNELPFGITPDTSFFFSSDSAQQALNTVLVAAREGEGFIKVTGEVGTGKTLLCRLLLSSVGPEFQTAYLPNPHQTPPGLLLELAAELGARTSSLSGDPGPKHWPKMLKSLNQRLLELAKANKRVLVCLDEVQAMPYETLEALRMLSNLETEKRKLMQVVIFGQPELEARLNHPSIRQLKQRITFEHRLGTLTQDELERYVNHRLAVAGYSGPPLFSRAAMRMLWWRSKGFPRLVNIAAHKALLSAYGRGGRIVCMRDVHAAAQDTGSMQQPSVAHLLLRRPLAFATWACAGMVAVGLVLAANGLRH